MIVNLTSSGGAASTKFGYTGDMTETTIVSNDVAYTLYTLKSSGTLSTGRGVTADVWICGGGAAGASGPTCTGGAGAYSASLSQTDLEGDYIVAIGAAGGASAFGTLLSVSAVSGKNGGSGGGGGGYINSGGTGDGIAKYPFGDTVNFHCPCAGGGGGSHYDNPHSDGAPFDTKGGNGGSNGGNGADPVTDTTGTGSGGSYGGGSGGQNATYYGSGGGGGSYSNDSWWPSSAPATAGGAGYQGVCFVRVAQQ